MGEERFGRLQRLERLKNMLASREEWVGSEIKMVIMLFRDVKQLFDESISKLIIELREEIGLLESIGDDMSKENTQLALIEGKFEKTNKKLDEILMTADQGLITSIMQIDLDVGLDAWDVIEKVNAIKTDIDRWAQREIREYDTVIEAVEREMQRRGVSNP